LKKLTNGDYPALKGLFSNQPYRLSNYSLPSLIAWSRTCHENRYAVSEGCVFLATVSAGNPADSFMHLPVFAEGIPTPEELRAMLQRWGYRKVCFVPEDYLEKFHEESLASLFHVSEQVEYADYIYLTKDLAELKGNRYAKKRNLIHQFERDYVRRNRVVTGPLTEREVPESLAFLEKWCELRDCDTDQEENEACERLAVIHALETIDLLDWRGIWVRIDGEISAFAIMSPLTADMGVLNFEKAFPQVKGLYQFLDRECARQLFHDCLYINKESDMGLTALADSKKSYCPVEKIRSYCLTLRS